MKLFSITMTCENPSANSFLGIYDKENMEKVKKDWENIASKDKALSEPYYGDIKLIVVEYELNKGTR